MNETYIVKKGDTLYGISNQFGVSVSEIARFNHLTGNIIQVGQVLQIPRISGSNPPMTFTYTVKKGDSLYSIARVYNTTVDEIMKLNNLRSTVLSIGQKLLINESGESVTVPPTFINYTVKKGDNLYSIARANNLTIDTIMKDNALQNTNLQIGQNLKIRTSREGVSTNILECFGSDYEVPVEDTIYVVKKGDSLYSIARALNTDVNAIKRKNNLTSNLLQVGQNLKI